MPKLVSVHTNSILVEYPRKWECYANIPVECSIYESENRAPGKRWFYIFDDSSPSSVDYLHCSPADASYSADGRTVTFETESGSRYVIELGDEQDPGYIPYRVLGHGAQARLLPSTAALAEMLDGLAGS